MWSMTQALSGWRERISAAVLTDAAGTQIRKPQVFIDYLMVVCRGNSRKKY